MGERGQLTMTEYTRQTTIHYHTPQAPHAYSISKYLFSLFSLAMGPFPGSGLGPTRKTGCA